VIAAVARSSCRADGTSSRSRTAAHRARGTEGTAWVAAVDPGAGFPGGQGVEMGAQLRQLRPVEALQKSTAHKLCVNPLPQRDRSRSTRTLTFPRADKELPLRLLDVALVLEHEVQRLRDELGRQRLGVQQRQRLRQ